MAQYIVKEDIVILDHVLYKKGDEINFTNDSITILNKEIGNLELTLNSIRSKLKPKDEIKSELTELHNEDELKDYRIQLDVKTTRKKAKEIEIYLRETLERMI